MTQAFSARQWLDKFSAEDRADKGEPPPPPAEVPAPDPPPAPEAPPATLALIAERLDNLAGVVERLERDVQSLRTSRLAISQPIADSGYAPVLQALKAERDELEKAIEDMQDAMNRFHERKGDLRRINEAIHALEQARQATREAGHPID